MNNFGPAKAIRIPSEQDKAYAAGFFDGEGNITIAMNQRGGARGIYRTYNMRVGASQNNTETLFWLRDRWSGTVRPIKRSTPHRGHEWQCFARQALRFLNDVLPFLQVKHERAILALKYQNMIVQRGRAGRTPEHLATMALMKSTMNILNAHHRAEMSQ